MTTQHRPWQFTPDEQRKFDDWMARIMVGHTGATDVRNPAIHWTPLRKPLSQCIVSLFTTGGVHLRSDTPFDIDNPHGDWDPPPNPHRRRHPRPSRNPLPLQPRRRRPRHQLYVPPRPPPRTPRPGPNRRHRPTAYSIMGFNPDPDNLMSRTAPALAQAFQDTGADLIFMNLRLTRLSPVLGTGTKPHRRRRPIHHLNDRPAPHHRRRRRPPRRHPPLPRRQPSRRSRQTHPATRHPHLGPPGRRRPHRPRRNPRAALPLAPLPRPEQPVYAAESQGAYHPQTAEIAAALDHLSRLIQDYKTHLEQRAAHEDANPSGIQHAPQALHDAVDRAAASSKS